MRNTTQNLHLLSFVGVGFPPPPLVPPLHRIKSGNTVSPFIPSFSVEPCMVPVYTRVHVSITEKNCFPLCLCRLKLAPFGIAYPACLSDSTEVGGYVNVVPMPLDESSSLTPGIIMDAD